jgi:hypothetical protein
MLLFPQSIIIKIKSKQYKRISVLSLLLVNAEQQFVLIVFLL